MVMRIVCCSLYGMVSDVRWWQWKMRSSTINSCSVSSAYVCVSCLRLDKPRSTNWRNFVNGRSTITWTSGVQAHEESGGLLWTLHYDAITLRSLTVVFFVCTARSVQLKSDCEQSGCVDDWACPRSKTSTCDVLP